LAACAHDCSALLRPDTFPDAAAVVLAQRHYTNDQIGLPTSAPVATVVTGAASAVLAQDRRDHRRQIRPRAGSGGDSYLTGGTGGGWHLSGDG